MGYFQRLFDAFLGHEAPPPPPAQAVDDAAQRSRLASLEMDVRERDDQIARMQKEYAALQAAGQRAAAGAGQDQLEQLFRKLALPMASFATLAALAAAGQELRVQDLIASFRLIEKQLMAAGLEQLEETGVSVSFDIALHQRMSGGSVSPGTPVTVRMPGYRFGGKVLLKAMVTARETDHE